MIHGLRDGLCVGTQAEVIGSSRSAGIQLTASDRRIIFLKDGDGRERRGRVPPAGNLRKAPFRRLQNRPLAPDDSVDAPHALKIDYVGDIP